MPELHRVAACLRIRSDRFHIEMHRETRASQVFELVQAKGGHKLKEYVEEPAAPAKKGNSGDGPRLRPGVVAVSGRRGTSATTVQSAGMPASQIAGMLARYLAKPVTDATGLTGRYDVRLHFKGEGLAGVRDGDEPGASPTASEPSGAPNLFKAVEEQLGLKLEQKKGTIEIIVIDKAQKIPTPN